MAGKHSKAVVGYTPKAAKHDERCELCRHFIKTGACKLVKGEISPKAWCKLYEAKAHHLMMIMIRLHPRGGDDVARRGR